MRESGKRYIEIVLDNGEIIKLKLSDYTLLNYQRNYGNDREFEHYFGFSPDRIEAISKKFCNFREIDINGKIIRY